MNWSLRVGSSLNKQTKHTSTKQQQTNKPNSSTAAQTLKFASQMEFQPLVCELVLGKANCKQGLDTAATLPCVSLDFLLHPRLRFCGRGGKGALKEAQRMGGGWWCLWTYQFWDAQDPPVDKEIQYGYPWPAFWPPPQDWSLASLCILTATPHPLCSSQTR